MMENRYSYLLKPGAIYDSSDDEDGKVRESQQYAAFLRDKERKCARDGFVDSQKLQNNYGSSSKDKKEKSDKDKSQRFTVVDLLAKKDKDKKDYEARLKVIEDHMWQHKQEERELKRTEGDIIKNQRLLRRSLRDYENGIQRKRLAEEKRQNQELEKYSTLQQQHIHGKEDLTKQRIEANQTSEQNSKETGRKTQLVTSKLSREYQTKMGELEVKRIELERLSQEFESRLRRKEEEQYRLKQELADLSISLNMEAQKGRSTQLALDKDKKKQSHQKLEDDRKTQERLEAKLHRGEGDAKDAEQNRRRMSADLTTTRSQLQLKQREEQRHRKDTDNRLRENNMIQKQLNDAALHAEMDLKNRQIEQKIQEHNQRRHMLASQTHRQRRESTEQHNTQFSQRFQRRFADQQRREHEDHLKHFQKSVTRGEDVEYNLYNTVKNMEYTRQKKEQAVRKTSQELQELQRQNAQRIKAEMLEAAKREQDLQQKLAREQAMLAKVHANREESYLMLQKQRDQLRKDKYLLSEHEREHDRLVRVSQKTENLSA